MCCIINFDCTFYENTTSNFAEKLRQVHVQGFQQSTSSTKYLYCLTEYGPGGWGTGIISRGRIALLAFFIFIFKAGFDFIQTNEKRKMFGTYEIRGWPTPGKKQTKNNEKLRTDHVQTDYGFEHNRVENRNPRK